MNTQKTTSIWAYQGDVTGSANAKLTNAQSVRKSEEALKERGGRRMPNGYLQPDGYQALQELLSADYAKSASAAINLALIDAKKRLKKCK